MKQLIRSIAQLSLLSLVIALALGINYLSAWSGPPGSFPTCPTGTTGCDAPVNVGATGQIKTGGLTASALVSSGGAYVTNKLGIGSGKSNPAYLIDLGGTPGTDGIRFPDGSVQTVAATGGTFASMQCVSATSAYIAGTASIACGVGYTAVSGGCQSACSMIRDNYLSGNTQMCAITNTAGSGICNQAGQTNVRANILCCK